MDGCVVLPSAYRIVSYRIVSCRGVSWRVVAMSHLRCCCARRSPLFDVVDRCLCLWLQDAPNERVRLRLFSGEADLHN